MNLNFDEKIMSSRYEICSPNSGVLIYQQETRCLRINLRAFGNSARHETEQEKRFQGWHELLLKNKPSAIIFNCLALATNYQYLTAIVSEAMFVIYLRIHLPYASCNYAKSFSERTVA